jgi:hypothetical protein
MPSFPYSLPDGITLEALDEYARAMGNRQRRESYARHPERVMRQRLVSAANLLTRHGLIDEPTRAEILERVREVGA